MTNYRYFTDDEIIAQALSSEYINECVVDTYPEIGDILFFDKANECITTLNVYDYQEHNELFQRANYILLGVVAEVSIHEKQATLITPYIFSAYIDNSPYQLSEIYNDTELLKHIKNTLETKNAIINKIIKNNDMSLYVPTKKDYTLLCNNIEMYMTAFSRMQYFGGMKCFNYIFNEDNYNPSNDMKEYSLSVLYKDCASDRLYAVLGGLVPEYKSQCSEKNPELHLGEMETKTYSLNALTGGFDNMVDDRDVEIAFQG